MNTQHRSLADIWHLLQNHGPSGLSVLALRRTTERLSRRFDSAAADLPLRIEDLAYSGELRAVRPLPNFGPRLRIGWVCTPPAGGSGGHTTLFRMVGTAEERGHECTLFLYDKNSDDVRRHETVVRQYWPQLKARVSSATAGFEGVDALVASSWATAHVVAKRAPDAANCFYFIQDFEPYFYPRGALYALAEDTYRFGFTNIALGEMVASRLRSELDIEPDAMAPFGCDDQYGLLPLSAHAEPRTGVVYYAKQSVDRRGYLLAKLALERFHELHPEQTIHVFGDRVVNWPFPVTNHGSLSPSDLNVLYNQTIASLVLSFTNISLVAEEASAAGNVPILNDHPFAKAVMSARYAVWARPTPEAMAQALSDAVSSPDIERRARRVGESERNGWHKSAIIVSEVIEKRCGTPELLRTPFETLKAEP